jgi:hypothetical protein
MSSVSRRLRENMSEDSELVSINVRVPKNSVVVGVAILCKYMDSEGEIHYTEGGDKGLSIVETLGMVTAYADSLRHKISKISRRS